jgi:hypothetical protein
MNMFGAPPLKYWRWRQWRCALSPRLAFGWMVHLSTSASALERHSSPF